VSGANGRENREIESGEWNDPRTARVGASARFGTTVSEAYGSENHAMASGERAIRSERSE
jgi:hypothetical protein